MGWLGLGLLGVGIMLGEGLAGEDRLGDAARAVVTSYNEAFQDYVNALRSARTPQEREAAEAKRPAPVADADELIGWAERNPKDPAAMGLLSTVVRHGRFSAEAQRAAKILARDHLGLKGQAFTETANQVTLWPRPFAEAWLMAYVEGSPDRSVRAVACLHLAHYKKWLAEKARQEMGPRWIAQIEETFGRGSTDYLKGLDPDRLTSEAVALFDRVVRDFGDVESDGHRLADQAVPFLLELTGLAIGRPAPEIASEDLDGRPLRLSDQRGKVVVLNFWATWCAPCMASIPRERALVKTLEGKPFAFLGINCDKDRDAARRAIAQHQIPWNSWWDHAARKGAITGAWNVRKWPTLYVIDAQGVIRYKDLHGEELERAVENLLAEAKIAVP